MADLNDLVGFLGRNARPDVKAFALEYVVGLTGSDEGLSVFSTKPELLDALIEITRDSNEAFAANAYRAIVNTSAECLSDRHCQAEFVNDLTTGVLKTDFKHGEESSMILSNLSRGEEGARRCFRVIESDNRLSKLIDVFCKDSANNPRLDHIATFLSNLAQLREMREALVSPPRCLLQRLMPFVGFQKSHVRRRGIVGVIRNCCLDTACHPQLLTDDMNIVSYLALPLAGPEDYDDDEIDRLPPDLQYLPPDKTREVDPALRTMLLESLTQLCATKAGRLFLKDSGVYLILRELHKWEKEGEAKRACLNLVEVLIAEEPEPGMENLHEVEIPAHVQEQLDKQRREEMEAAAAQEQ